MWEKLSYSNRTYLLIGGYVLCLLLIYQIAIKGTVKAGNECGKLERKLIMAENAPRQIAVLEKRINELDAFVNSATRSETERHELLLATVSNYCQINRLVLKRFPITHRFSKHNYIIYTDIITIEGGFIQLLKLLNNIELNKRLGKIASVDFNSWLDKKNKHYKLNMTIYVQNFQYITETKPE